MKLIKRFKPSKALFVTAKNVRRVNGELISRPGALVVNAPQKVLRIVQETTFSAKDIDLIGRDVMREHAIK